MDASSIAEVLVMGLVQFYILLTILMSEWSVLLAGLRVIRLGGGRNGYRGMGWQVLCALAKTNTWDRVTSRSRTGWAASG